MYIINSLNELPQKIDICNNSAYNVANERGERV